MADNTINQDILQFLRDIDNITDEMYETSARALREGAKIIEGEQRRLISSKSSVLASLIKTSRITLSKKKRKKDGRYRIGLSIGYFGDDIREHPETVIMEFGRPGKSPKAKKHFTFVNKNGKKVTKRIGKVNAVPHIRLGFDSKKEEAAAHVFKIIESEVLSKWSK